MDQTNNHSQSKQMPNEEHSLNQPLHRKEAVDFLRQQVDQAYKTSSPQIETPQTYAHTYRQEAKAQKRPLSWEEYHQAWQQYYQQYYQSYYLEQIQKKRAQFKPESNPVKEKARNSRFQETRRQLLATIQVQAKKAKASPHLKPIAVAMVVGIVFLFLQFNRTLIAQAKYYISPGTIASKDTSIIFSPSEIANVGPESKIIIPKINVDVPVVYDELSYNDAKIQKALERGVVHYGHTSLPGQVGNNVIVGHSSNDLFDSGNYKFAFVLIDRLEKEDSFMLHYKGKRYVYKVYNKAIIKPNDFSLINIQPNEPVITLVTCTPPGTALKRLVVQAKQISPAPNKNQLARSSEQTAAVPSAIPGNSPTLLERIKGIFN